MRRVLPVLAGVAGLDLVVVGVVLFRAGGLEGVSYQATYGPLPDVDSSWAFTGTQAVGAGLVVLGLVVLAALGGWLLGHRGRPA